MLPLGHEGNPVLVRFRYETIETDSLHRGFFIQLMQVNFINRHGLRLPVPLLLEPLVVSFQRFIVLALAHVQSQKDSCYD